MIRNKIALNMWRKTQKEKTRHQLKEMYNNLSVDEHKVLDYAIEHDLTLKQAVEQYKPEEVA